MPPLPEYSTPAMRAVEDALSTGGRRGARRIVEAIESLAVELDPASEYPVDWLVFRLSDEPARGVGPSGVMVRGDALTRDACVLAERIAERAGLLGRDAPPASISPGVLAGEWSVSVKTINRYRAMGLVAWRVRDEAGRVRVVISRAMAERFKERHTQRVRRAAAFERTGAAVEERIIRRAARYRRVLGMSLNAAAGRLALRFGRSHEAVRQVLLRSEQRSTHRVFGERPPPSAWRRRVALRALRLGIEPTSIGERWGRGAPSVIRLAVERRAELLRSLDLGGSADHEASRRELDEALSSQAVRSEVGSACEPTLLGQIESARRHRVPIGAAEAMRVRARRRLIDAAGVALSILPTSGARVADVDQAETWLRWASLLKIELIRSQLPLALRTFEAQVSTPIDQFREGEARDAISECVATLSGVIDRFEPGTSGRLAAPASIAINRLASRWKKHRREGLAASIIRNSARAADWTRTIDPWQAWLWADPRLRLGAELIEPEQARILALRFGWGTYPRTGAEVCKELHLTPMRLGVLERQAIRSATAASRAGKNGPGQS